MAQLLTRPQFRDALRRLMQIVPPIDNGSGIEGQQPSYSPFPTNASLNDALQDALSDINNACQIHVTQGNLDVDAQSATEQGPFTLYMGDLEPHTTGATIISPVGTITDIRRIVWDDGSGTLVRLDPVDRDALDRRGSNYFTTYPGTPRYYYVEGYKLTIFPAQAVAGTYIITVGTGFVGLQGETDVIDQFPIDFQSTLKYQALYHLSIMQTMDTEAAQRAASYGPLARAGMAFIAGWKKNLTGPQQPQLGALTYSRGYGMTRSRR